MLPVLHLGPFTIATYPLLYALGVLVGGTLAYGKLRNRPGDPAHQRNAVLLMIAAILVGLYLPAWLVSQAAGLLSGNPPEPVRMRVYYGLACGLLAVVLYCRKYRLPLLAPLDETIPAFALGFAIARLGCLAAGCCGGQVTSSAFSLNLPDESGQWAQRYPTQLLSLLVQLALFWGLTRFNAWRARAAGVPAGLRLGGVTSCAYVFFFCLERFSLEFFRQDYAPIWQGFSQPHLWMLAGMLGCLGWAAALVFSAGRPAGRSAATR